MCQTTAAPVVARQQDSEPASPTGSTSSTSASSGAGGRTSPLVVLKVGTSSLMLSDPETGFRVNLANLARLVDTIGSLKRDGYQVVLVSSGAVGMGCIKLQLSSKPTTIRRKQAVAAAGQSHLVRIYEDLFGAINLQVAQLLINQSDFLDKDHWKSVKTTIQECLKLGVVPIINENDSTNTAEMRFGDNDNLAALTAVQLEADALFLCTDVDFLYTANPRSDPDAKALRVVDEPWALQVDTSDEGSGLGTGGMATKILAARTASTAGIPCGLINGEHPERVYSFLEYGMTQLESRQQDAAASTSTSASAPVVPEGTLFMPMQSEHLVCDTRRWILSLPATATVTVDDKCARGLARRKSLRPDGISKVVGSFARNEAVKLLHRGKEIGRGLVNVSSQELFDFQAESSGDSDSDFSLPLPAETCDHGHVVLTVDPRALSAH